MVEQRVASFFKRQGLSPDGLTAGVALSGGADSVALLAAMRSLGWECAALHCNFHLRGAESDRDSRHAEEVAARLGCRFVSVDFNVGERRAATGESLEMACRELRYEWFERIAAELGLGFIAIAHHADDREETFLMNALRGTGLKGLCGIPERRGIFVRPMLDCPRREIIEYLDKAGLDYVTDSSNLVDDVKRNKLRLNVLPAIHRDFPSASKGLRRTMENLRSDYDLLAALVDREGVKYIFGDEIRVSELLADYGSGMGQNLLYRFMKQVAGCEGDPDASLRVVASVSESGRYFDFGHRRFLLDRGRLVLLCWERAEEDAVSFNLKNLKAGEPLVIDLGAKAVEAELLPAAAFDRNAGPGTIWLDEAALGGQLTLRHPRLGDRIAPFGMKGTALLSKLMKDAKVPDNEKPRQWVLLAGDKVLWLCGIRCSKHYPVTAASTRVVRLRFISQD